LGSSGGRGGRAGGLLGLRRRSDRSGGETSLVLVITGPSGAGKGTLIRALLPRVPELELAVSATTRLRRAGEVEDRDYYYFSEADFARRVANGEFLEHITYVSGQRYGTLRTEVERIGREGRITVLELETEGALKVAEALPGVVTVFVTAPRGELERRLRERATESAGEIGERLDLAESQLLQASLFDHVVENDDLDRAVDELVGIVAAARRDADR
jgi:guanylate kinase